jgi:hypothetical protein
MGEEGSLFEVGRVSTPETSRGVSLRLFVSVYLFLFLFCIF